MSTVWEVLNGALYFKNGSVFLSAFHFKALIIAIKNANANLVLAAFGVITHKIMILNKESITFGRI